MQWLERFLTWLISSSVAVATEVGPGESSSTLDGASAGPTAPASAVGPADSPSMPDAPSGASSSPTPPKRRVAEIAAPVTAVAVLAGLATWYLLLRRRKRRQRDSAVRPYPPAAFGEQTPAARKGDRAAHPLPVAAPEVEEPPERIAALQTEMQRAGFSFDALLASLGRVHAPATGRRASALSRAEEPPPTYQEDA